MPVGEIRMALLAAASHRPAVVRDLAARAQVGYEAARRTCSRMVNDGVLVEVAEVRHAGPGRPAAVLAPANHAPPMAPQGDTIAEALDRLHRSFWRCGVMDLDEP